ncbi:MAG: FlgD immunoglobulin-like domain containing protein [Candidatus Eisenbacteria bacterium]
MACEHAATANISLLSALLLLFPAISVAAGLWSAPTLVGIDDDMDSICASVGISADGSVVVVWSAIDSVQYDSEIMYVTIRDGVQSEQAMVHSPNAEMDRIPFMSVGDDGVPWIVWERYGNGYEQVVSHFTGAGWSSPEIALDQGGRYDWYNIYAANSSDVWVARSSRPPGVDDREIELRRWDGNTWGDVERVGVSGKDDVSPVMVRGSDSRLWLAWVCNLAIPGRNVVYAACCDSTGWSTPVRVDTTAGNGVVCDMDLCPDGRPVVVWVGNGYTTSTDLEYAVLQDSGWAYGGLVNEPDDIWNDRDASARLSRRSYGSLWVTWKSGIQGTQDAAITAARWTGEGWSEEELVSVPDTSQLAADKRPDCAVAPSEVVWCVWDRSQESSRWDSDIFISSRDVATPVDFWGFEAEVSDGGVHLTWNVAGSHADLQFSIWRLTETDETAAHCGGVPDGAVRLNDLPVGDCGACAYLDTAVSPGERYLYWLQDASSALAFGPVRAILPGASPNSAQVHLDVAPNPASDGIRIVVSGLPEGSARVRIYTAAGKLVRSVRVAPEETSSGVAYWDGRDSEGRRMPSGVYYAVLEVGRQAVASGRGTVVILR